MKPALGRPSTFKREDIVDCALKMLDRDGVRALTLRGVARELGCVLGTINYYFSNLADLEDAVAVRLMEKVPVLDATRKEPLRDQLVELGLVMIDLHSTHPNLRQAAGPSSIELAAQQLQQQWSALQALGLPEPIAMLCLEMISGLAHNRGTEIYRLRNGGEQALHLHEELVRKAGKTSAIKLKTFIYSPESLEQLHREMLGTAVDIFLRGAGVKDQVKKTRAATRK